MRYAATQNPVVGAGHSSVAVQSAHLLTTFDEKLENVRADRRITVLLILKAKGRVTAAELATELEVSIATARRGLEALSMAGVLNYALGRSADSADRWSPGRCRVHRQKAAMKPSDAFIPLALSRKNSARI